MTTLELHIEIDLLFQKVNSHYNQNLKPGEKDVFLNREQLKFINKLINPLNSIKRQAAFDVIKKTTELAPLLRTVELPLLVDTNKKEASILLPFDCLYYVASSLSACPSCTTRPFVSSNVFSLDLPTIKSRSELPISISQGNKSITIDPSDIPDAYLIPANNPQASNQFLINNALLILLSKKARAIKMNIEFTFDKEKNLITARSYDFFSAGGKAADVESYNTYAPFDTDLNAEVTIEDEEFMFKANNSFLSGSKDKNVLALLRNEKVKFKLPKGVIYGVCKLVYISKPNKIDVYLNSNSNLTDAGLVEVVGNLVQTLHGVIGTDSYEKYVRENTLIE